MIHGLQGEHFPRGEGHAEQLLPRADVLERQRGGAGRPCRACPVELAERLPQRGEVRRQLGADELRPCPGIALAGEVGEMRALVGSIGGYAGESELVLGEGDELAFASLKKLDTSMYFSCACSRIHAVRGSL